MKTEMTEEKWIVLKDGKPNFGNIRDSERIANVWAKIIGHDGTKTEVRKCIITTTTRVRLVARRKGTQ